MSAPPDPRAHLARTGIALPWPLRAFILLLAALTLACGVAEFIAHHELHYPLEDHHAYPLLWEYYPDFQYFPAKFQHLHTLGFFTTDPLHPFMYPAPVALVYASFYKAGGAHALRLFLAAMILSFSGAALLFARAMRRHGLPPLVALAFAGCTLLLSYPIWFVFHQANMESAVWVLLSLGLVAFFHRKPYPAAICFATAGAMKLFPFVYLGLLLARRQYRAIAVSLIAAVALSVFALWVVYPDIPTSWHLIQAGVANFREVYMLHLRPERGFDHSLFGLYKQLTPTLPEPAKLGHVLSGYLLLAASAGVALFFFRIRKMPVINQVLCLTIASILLPPTSFDYTLIHLYAPWVLLVFYALDRSSCRAIPTWSPALLLILLCFAVLFAPLTELILHDEILAGPIRAIVLVGLFALGLTYPLQHNDLELACDPGSGAIAH